MTDSTVIEVRDTVTVDITETGGQVVTVEATPTVHVDITTSGIQGPPGPQGPTGEPGAPGGTRFTHTQANPAPVWSVQHNLGYEPVFSTVVIDGTDVTDGADIFHIDTSNLTISFSEPVAGKAAFL